MSAGIDWSRLAEPQADGYDTGVIVRLAGASEREPVHGGSAMFGGRTALTAREGALRIPHCSVAPLDHPNIARGEALVALWPAAHRQCGALLREVSPFVDTTRTPEQWRHSPGSSSDGFPFPFGVVAATVDNAHGFAQALVHETAHHKLRALGVQLQRAERLIDNDPAQLYESPIVRDRRRPMTAVVHAQYSFMHVTALDVAMYDAAPDDETRAAAAYLLARNVPRMETGRREIAAHLRPDAAGEAFFAAFERWSEPTLRRGRAILDECGLGRARLDGSYPSVTR
ncbi:MAG: HEXXH motif-containing putative peptide modification protein [Candidatus Eremiobacteraeota bacterium]|nr:HEXXH motif-containing putative peptide modification protein [Candidatus Eremiobacteraeota bacterium]